MANKKPIAPPPALPVDELDDELDELEPAPPAQAATATETDSEPEEPAPTVLVREQGPNVTVRPLVATTAPRCRYNWSGWVQGKNWEVGAGTPLAALPPAVVAELEGTRGVVIDE